MKSLTASIYSVLLTAILVSTLCAIPSPAAADIYKCIGTDGKLSFSDTPCPPTDKEITIQEQPSRSTSGSPAVKSKQKTPLKNSTKATTKPAGRALVRLKNGSTLELETRSMQSSRGLTWHTRNNLMLPNGVYVPYMKMKTLTVLPGSDKDRVRIKIVMRDGNTSTETIKAPITYISGKTGIGKFNKKLYEIDRIDFL